MQLDISFEEDPVEAEDDFREMIENQFYSEYIEGEQDLDPDVEEELEEIIEEMWEMPIRKITFIDWLDSEENLKWLNQCYVALWQVLFCGGNTMKYSVQLLIFIMRVRNLKNLESRFHLKNLYNNFING